MKGSDAIVRIATAQRQQIVTGYAQPCPGIVGKISLDQIRVETVEAGIHRRMRGEKIAHPGDG